MRITEPTMSAAGIMPGDVVLVVDGDEVAPYRWNPPFFLPSSTTDARPVALKGSEDQVVGVVVDLIRQLQPSAPAVLPLRTAG